MDKLPGGASAQVPQVDSVDLKTEKRPHVPHVFDVFSVGLGRSRWPATKAVIAGTLGQRDYWYGVIS